MKAFRPEPASMGKKSYQSVSQICMPPHNRSTTHKMRNIRINLFCKTPRGLVAACTYSSVSRETRHPDILYAQHTRTVKKATRCNTFPQTGNNAKMSCH